LAKTADRLARQVNELQARYTELDEETARLRASLEAARECSARVEAERQLAAELREQIAATRQSCTDLAERVEALEEIRPEEAGPGDRVFGLSGRQVGRRVGAAVAAAGLGGGLSGHSGRTGLAAELSRAGASTHEIAAVGGWKSAGMVIRYTRKETARRGAVARYLEGREEPHD
jgi:hypothetical protein